MTQRPSKKSTIVRAGLVRLLGALSWLAPSLAADRRADVVHDSGVLPFGIGDRRRRAVCGPGRETTGPRAAWGEGPVVYLVHGWAGDSRRLARWSDRWWRPVTGVVAFDGPSHGRSDPGASGPGRSHAVEFADALAAVAARHGPARAVVAHSMGAMATMLTLRDNRLSAERLVFVAPMHELRSYLDRFAAGLNLGRRARHRLDASLEAHVGMLVEEFELLSMAEQARDPSLLVVHDRDDRRLAWAGSVELVDRWPDARLVTTEGLGHSRLLGDPAVHAEIVRFVSP